jgi:PIN domain nuclease of toxin-antitoxin system
MLQERGRTDIGPAELEAMLARNPNFAILSLDLDQVHEFAALRAVRDPFDRMIAAAAIASRSPLLSVDSALGANGAVEVVWD